MDLLMKTNTRITLLIISSAMLISCGKGKVFEEYKKLPDYNWNRFDNIIFEADIEDADVNYNIYIAIRHITNYPFKNLVLTSIMTTPGGEERFLDHDLRIRDDNGKPLGNGMGDIWDINIPIRNNFRFKKPGRLIIEFENRMPRPVTQGIMEVGLIIEKV
jgi:gliding motility-associated lipoprotein GldH